jgi:D-alanyl-D-alanine carboxypeptidase
MNKNAQRLGMTQTSYVNPNGLPADGQITSARDLGILARAIIRDLPEYEYFMHIPAIKFGRRVTANFNKLIGRYPGADGMKTGFICASGFNLVATATRNNKRLIAVVLGASSSAQRALKAAQLLERGFGSNRLSWLKPSLGTVDALAPIDASPPNLRDEMCGPKRKRPAAETDDEDPDVSTDSNDSGISMFTAGLQTPTMKVSDLLAMPAAAATPVIVYTGPARTGADVLAADAAETAAQAASVAKRKKGARPKIAAKPNGDDAKTAKPDAKPKQADHKPAAKPVAAKPAPKADKKQEASAKPEPAKPSSAKPSNAKPAAAKPAAPKPAAAKPAATPAKPAAQQKPDAAPRG